ncbi:MAG: tyrosine-type recombinase/integrase [Boseongicola sp. SB0664_bin_43]|uniref:Tyrosine-type recombinase/integrase n=1 Tax=Boseongicola sp. SB0664_bin_43 TaxID=2604844 RepID=A0A6B0Y3Q1_9RHOB|nr:tyrosine-type recombinase/integrase [Boseongicola sp. SB0664_bin_43]
MGQIYTGAVLCTPVRCLAALPQYIRSEDVERTIAACDAGRPAGMRDRAIILLLARLALRAGDIVGLCLSDIDFRNDQVKESTPILCTR